MRNLNQFNIPNTKLYTKYQILDMINSPKIERYYSPVTGEYYNAILDDNKLFAKEYPERNLYYLKE